MQETKVSRGKKSAVLRVRRQHPPRLLQPVRWSRDQDDLVRMQSVTQPMKRAPSTNDLRGTLHRDSHRQAARFGDRRATLMLFAV